MCIHYDQPDGAPPQREFTAVGAAPALGDLGKAHDRDASHGFALIAALGCSRRLLPP